MTTRQSPAIRGNPDVTNYQSLNPGPLTVVASTIVLAGAVGFALAKTSDPAATAIGLCGVIVLILALVVRGPRQVASLSLYGCAVSLALPSLRVLSWMTVSDALLLCGGLLLLPELPNLKLRAPGQRMLMLAVALIVLGGLLGAITAKETDLALINLGRLVVASGATLLTFALWAPSACELRRFLVLVILSGLITSTWAIATTGANFGRPSGLSEHPNHLALIALVAAGPAIAFSLTRGTRRLWRLASASASVVLIGGVVVSGSRAGLLGLVVAILIAATLSHGPGLRWRLAFGAAIIVAAAIVGFSALTPENAVERSFNPVASVTVSDEQRRAVFSEMLHQIREHPLTGVGFSDPLGGHDAYLQLWAAGGLLAFLGGFLVVVFAAHAVAVSRHLRPLDSNLDPQFPLFATTISLVGLLAALAFHNALWSRYIWVAVALVASSLVRARRAAWCESAR